MANDRTFLAGGALIALSHRLLHKPWSIIRERGAKDFDDAWSLRTTIIAVAGTAILAALIIIRTPQRE